MTTRARHAPVPRIGRARLQPIAVSALLVVLFGCGGGGGGGEPPPPPGGGRGAPPAPLPISPLPPDDSIPDNEAPVADDSVVQLETWTAYEGVLPGSDPDGDALRFEVYRSFVPFVITNPSTGAYRYDPLQAKRSGEVVYRVVDEHGLVDFATITFLHDTQFELGVGECPRTTIELGEPVAGVWTHPDDTLLFVGFGADRVEHVKRYHYYSLGDESQPPMLELLGTVLGETKKFLIDPDEPSIIYALASDGGLDISHDAGSSFTRFSLTQPLLDIAVTSGQPGFFFAVTEHGVYRAEKDDLDFALVHTFNDVVPNPYHTIAVHPDRPERMLVSGQDRLHRSDDSGATWSALPPAPTHELVVDPHDPERVYGNGGSLVYLSSDFGSTWSLAGFNGFDNEILVTDPFRPGTLYIAPWSQFTGLWISDDDGGAFDRVDGLAERVRGIAFTSSGSMYVTQDQSLRCLPQFGRPLLPANSRLSLDLRIENAQGESVAERDVLDAVFARLNVDNLSGQPLSDIVIDIWVESPGSRSFVYRQSDWTIDPQGTELLVTLPSPAVAGRYKVVASVDTPADAPVGSISWFVAVSDPPAPVDTGEFAVLSANTLWLNLVNPWVPIVTDIGEQRRTVLDVRNEGPDTARNVTATIGTGSILRLDSVGPIYIGQTVNCYSTASAVTCDLGDLAAGDTVSLELYVTPLTQLSAVPVAVTSDTPDHGVLNGGLDLVASISAPAERAAGAGVGYSITVTNTGDEQAASGYLRGAIGPWPALTSQHDVAFSDPRCSLDDARRSATTALTYMCSFWFLHPGESVVVDVQIAPATAAEVVHVVAATGFPGNDSSYWFELYTGNNMAGAITRVTGP